MSVASRPPANEPSPATMIVVRAPSPNNTLPANMRPRKIAPENAMNAIAATPAEAPSWSRR